MDLTGDLLTSGRLTPKPFSFNHFFVQVYSPKAMPESLEVDELYLSILPYSRGQSRDSTLVKLSFLAVRIRAVECVEIRQP